MSAYRISAERPPGWDALCEDQACLFGSSGWQAVLEAGFGCDTLYAWNGHGGAAISVFRAGPFRVGYLGFPAGLTVGSGVSRSDIISSLATASFPGKPVCIRSSVSAFGDGEVLPYSSVTNPETAITDLQQWSLRDVSQKARRIRKAEREGLSIERVTDATLGRLIFGIYENTVKSHGGSARYTESYFARLAEHSAADRLVEIRRAIMGADTAGFLVTGRHGDTTYYLHGGTNPGYRKLSPSDLLMADAIRSARDSGCARFNFMASPPKQDSLVRYKEKWGGETRPLQNYTARTGAAYPIFRIVESLYRLLF